MIEPIPLPLSKTSEERLRRYLRDRVQAIRSGLRELHETLLPQWRKAYEGTPAEKIREFPFHNASNIIIPIIAIHSDTLLARVMAAIIKVQPLWVGRLVGEFPKGSDELREAVESFMQDVGLEPTELDLYRVYHEWFGATIREGTGVVKSPWIHLVEDSVRASGDGLGSFDYEREVLYDGPRPEKLDLEDFGMDIHDKNVDLSKFKYHIVRLDRFDLEERGVRKIYDPEKVKAILKTPDRTSRRATQQQFEADQGARTVSGYGFAEWDIYECHFRYRIRSDRFVKAIAWYHEKTDTLLRSHFYHYPGEIFTLARLFYQDDSWLGYGFARMLWPFQEEVSQMHNQRRDNATVCNGKGILADPDSPLHRGYKIFPGVVVPGRKDEVSPFDLGTPNTVADIQEEEASISLADRRSGVSPPQQGFGAGTVNKKGAYSAMGTLSLLQEGNTRTDLNVTDIRYAHTRFGRLILNEFAEFGIGERAKLYGKMGTKLNAALDLVRKKLIRLPVTAATASVNREVEKQNDIMLSSIMQKHHGMMVQMLQMATNPMVPQPIKEYVVKAMESAELLQKAIMRNFGHDETERLVPSATPEPGQGPSPTAPAAAQVPGSQPGQLQLGSPLPQGAAPNGSPLPLGAAPEAAGPGGPVGAGAGPSAGSVM